MTAEHLLAYIGAALLWQVVAGGGIAFWRWRARAARAAQAPRFDEPEVRSPSAAAWPGWRDFRVTRRCFEDASKGQCSFHLQPVDGAPLPDFKPGQYLTFSLRVGAGAGAGEATGNAAGAGGSAAGSVIRCYSLSDGPDPATWRITVKRQPAPAGRPDLPPGASSTHFHDQVHEGDVLQVRAPTGHFFIDLDASVPVVLIAGGIGITPLLSMLRWCIAAQPGRAIHLYYGVRNRSDHAFKALLEALVVSHPAFRLDVVYSHPGPDDVVGRDCQHVGHIDLPLLRNSLSQGRHQFYVCGPAPMMQSLVPALRAWGVKEGDLHFEAFGPASVQPEGPAADTPAVAASASFDIRLDRSGRTLVWDGQDANLLDFVERHGVAVDSGCRSGSCGTCETRLVSGTVAYADKPDHEIAQGHCLLCVGQPQSALVLGV